MIYITRIFTCLSLAIFSLPATAHLSPPIEYLDWSKIRINSKLPLICNKTELIKLLGTADSIVTPKYDDICSSYFENGFKYIYWRNSQFETSGNLAVLSSIDFESSNIKLVSPNITLDKSVTLETIERMFPLAVKAAEVLLVDKKGKILSIKIATSKKESDDSWLLFFRKGKLVRIDHMIPC